jgi:hypothetical protein
MNTASQNLPHHLGLLREKLQHPTDYEKAVYYFLEEFAGDIGFVGQSLSKEAPHLVAVLSHVARKALGGAARVEQARVFYLPEFGFYHGNAPVDGRIALFFYFEEVDAGAVAFMLGAGPETQMARFRVNGAFVGGNPTRN